jgi:hypothetical protein
MNVLLRFFLFILAFAGRGLPTDKLQIRGVLQNAMKLKIPSDPVCKLKH